MDFREYFEPIDIFLLEAPQLIARGAGKVDPTIADPKTGKSYRQHNKLEQIKNVYDKAVRNNTKPEDLWGSFSCVERLGIKYNASYGSTPLGLYGYPLKFILERSSNYGRIDVPYGGNRTFLHIFKINKREKFISMKKGQGEIKTDDIRVIKDSISDNIYNYIEKKTKVLHTWLQSTLIKQFPEQSEKYYFKSYFEQLFFDQIAEIKDKFYYATDDQIKNHFTTIIQKIEDKYKTHSDDSIKFIKNDLMIDVYSFSGHIIDAFRTNSDSDIDKENEIANKINYVIASDAVAQNYKVSRKIGFIEDIDFDAEEIYLSERFLRIFQKITSVLSVDNNTSSSELINIFSKNKITFKEFEELLNNYGRIFYGISHHNEFYLGIIQNHKVFSNEKIKKIIKIGIKKLKNTFEDLKNKTEQIFNSLDFPFGNELKDFCDKNNLDWSNILRSAIGNTTDVAGKFIYEITKTIASKIIEKKGYIDDVRDNSYGFEENQKRYRTWAMWTSLLKKLGIDGMLDEEGTGSIYSSEPTQGFFINPKNIDLISTIQINDPSDDCGGKKSNKKNLYVSDALAGKSPIEQWFIGLNINLAKFRNEMSYDVVVNPEKCKKDIGRLSILLSSFITMMKKLDHQEYDKITDRGFLGIKENIETIKDKIETIKDKLSKFANNADLEQKTALFSLINNIVEAINGIQESNIFNGFFQQINFEKLDIIKTNLKKNTHNSGFSNLSKKYNLELSKLLNRSRLIANHSYYNGIPPNKSSEILAILDNFTNVLFRLKDLDDKLKNQFKLETPWRQTREFDKLYKVVIGIIENLQNIKSSVNIGPMNTLSYQWNTSENKIISNKIISKINQIEKCVFPNRQGSFWCWSVGKK